MLIEKSARSISWVPARQLAITLAGLTSHILLDKLARATYHPHCPLPRDRFWLMHYSLNTGSAGYLLFKHWRSYKTGILAALMPDVDWALFWGAALLPARRRSQGGRRLHGLGHRLVDALPFARLFHTLPDWNMLRRGAFLELVLCGLLARLLWPLGK